MSGQTFPVFVDQPGCTMRNFRVTGADVTSSPGSAGLDGRGQFLCEISSPDNIVFTVKWLQAFGDVPYVFFMPSAGQADTFIEIVSSTNQQLVFQVFTMSTYMALAGANVDVHVDSYNTTSFVS